MSDAEKAREEFEAKAYGPAGLFYARNLIAALEAEADTVHRAYDECMKERQQAESEVERIKARRCKDCRWYESGAMDPASCAVLQGYVPHNDFSCCDWTAREEAK